MKINGIEVDNIQNLIELLYGIKHIEEQHPVVNSPSCSHYQSVDDFQSKYCPDCGKLNEIIKTGGVKSYKEYTLKDIVLAKNGFDIYSTDGHKLENNIKLCLKHNNYKLYIGDYKYRLISSYGIGPMCMWVDDDGDVVEEACKDCYIYNNDMRTTFVISTHRYGRHCNHIFDIISENNSTLIFTGKLLKLSNANNLLETFAGAPVRNIYVEEYGHHCDDY